MTNSTNQILVQNVETFETITRLTVDVDSGETATKRIDQYFSKNDKWGIVSLDDDADGEYMNVLLVAPVDGPDFMMDMTTGEMEPVEDIDPAAELEAKMDIAMEIDNADEEFFLALETQDALKSEGLGPWLKDVEEASTITDLKSFDEFLEDFDVVTDEPKPRNTRKSKTKSLTKAKGAKMSTQPKQRNFEILAAFITNNPGVSRTDVFQDPGLLTSLRTMDQMQSIANGDKLEVKRWNRRLNFLIREMRRQGVDIQIERKGRVAHYTVGTPSGQLELPFDEAAEARNSAIIGNDVTDEVLEAPVPAKNDAMRLVEEPNQNLDFDALLATLDDEAVAPVK